MVAVQSAQAQTYKELYAFGQTGQYDGQYPYFGALVRDASGNLYGTTEYGGSGYGTVFKVSKTGSETVLYSFTGGADGGNPYGGLTIDGEGNLFGATFLGGDPNCLNGGYGCGMVFELSKSGKEIVLHKFTGGADGEYPYAGLVRDAEGNLYGTTKYGGYGYGTVFKVDAKGKHTVLHRFRAQGDGKYPGWGVLVRDTRGNLYGTTYGGGVSGGGAVFKVSRSSREKVLYSFSTNGGVQPLAGVIRDLKGNLYGTTSSGGSGTCYGGCGTVFRLDAKGKYAVLYSFTGAGDGGNPQAALVEDARENLYGTAPNDGEPNCIGSDGCGTAFKLDVSGQLSVLHTFTGSDGTGPFAPLVKDAGGNLYGTTVAGGLYACEPDSYGCGVVFEITP
jgi:uncharacterized repeat protein (TIGR03803 family)